MAIQSPRWVVYFISRITKRSHCKDLRPRWYFKCIQIGCSLHATYYWAPKKITNRQAERQYMYESTMIDKYIHKRVGDAHCPPPAINTQTPQLTDQPGVQSYPQLAKLTGEWLIGQRLQ